MKSIKFISFFMGISIFLFGALKFVDPFKSWYSAQIADSGLGELSYAMGILGELASGIVLILIFIFQSKISNKKLLFAVIVSSTVIAVMMITGIYVHLNPNVPADVLPLKIKPPFIPGFFLVLASLNILLAIKQYKRSSNR